MNTLFEKSIFYFYFFPFLVVSSWDAIITGVFHHKNIIVPQIIGRMYGITGLCVGISAFITTYIGFYILRRSHFMFLIISIKSGFTIVFIILFYYRLIIFPNTVQYRLLVYVGILLICTLTQYNFIRLLRKVITK